MQTSAARADNQILAAVKRESPVPGRRIEFSHRASSMKVDGFLWTVVTWGMTEEKDYRAVLMIFLIVWGFIDRVTAYTESLEMK